MAFDLCEHQKTQLLIKFGEALRIAKGLPPEKNITTLHKEACTAIGIEIVQPNSQNVNHMPAPHEMKDEEGN